MAPEQKSNHEDEQFHPRGTVAVMILFFFTTIALWGYVYLIMLSQGPTTP
ncbi:MAG: hypothetical protein ABTQ73_11955 [Caldilineales bacterium]